MLRVKVLFVIITLVFFSLSSIAVAQNTVNQEAARNNANVPINQFVGNKFSAMMLVSDEESITELQKDSHATPVIKAVNKFKRGEPAVISFVFYGMEVDENGNSDISADIKLLDAKGKVYNNMVLNDKRILKGKITDNSYVYHNEESTTITFDEGDSAGKYAISAVLKDNVGNKKVSFVKLIELIE